VGDVREPDGESMPGSGAGVTAHPGDRVQTQIAPSLASIIKVATAVASAICALVFMLYCYLRTRITPSDNSADQNPEVPVDLPASDAQPEPQTRAEPERQAGRSAEHQYREQRTNGNRPSHANPNEMPGSAYGSPRGSAVPNPNPEACSQNGAGPGPRPFNGIPNNLADILRCVFGHAYSQRVYSNAYNNGFASVDTPNEHNGEDLYAILGVSPTATSAEIKAAYRQRAMLLHPDKNNNSPESTEKFQKLNEAYRVLSNQQTRTGYDNERRSDAKPRAQHNMGGWAPADIFKQFFGQEGDDDFFRGFPR
jgi:hypothetical protein